MKNKLQAVYTCYCCRTVWNYVPEDYNSEYIPEYCPLCSMPITQMIHDVFIEEGLLEVFRMIFLRVKYLIKLL